MKKFFFFTLLLLIAGVALFNWLYSEVESDFKEARPAIIKESFESARKIATNPDATQTAFLNKNLTKRPDEAPVTAPSPTPISDDTGEESFLEQDPNGKAYWCKGHTPPGVRGGNKCVYPNACFSCNGSDIVPPEVAGSHPFCSDGTLSTSFDLICCPNSFDQGQLKCPKQAECFKDSDTSKCPLPPEMQSVLEQPESIKVQQGEADN